MGGGGASMDPSLDIVNFDPAKPAPDMDVMASMRTEGGRKFSCLAWGTAGTETGACPYGMVAGGLESGIVSLWNPAGILKGDGSGLIHSVQVHNGAVNCVEFNPLKPNLMASCGADSEVKIISLDDPTNPKMFAPSNNPSTHVGSEVLCCAWNRKLNHILCSCSDKGSTVVWDLKMMKEVINFKDPANRSPVLLSLGTRMCRLSCSLRMTTTGTRRYRCGTCETASTPSRRLLVIRRASSTWRGTPLIQI
jgi:protein transport protein SEC31